MAARARPLPHHGARSPPLVTHIFLAGGRYLDSDAVFGVKPSLIVEPQTRDGMLELAFDFTLDPT